MSTTLRLVASTSVGAAKEHAAAGMSRPQRSEAKEKYFIPLMGPKNQHAPRAVCCQSLTRKTYIHCFGGSLPISFVPAMAR
ncbi:hypothetical protein [Desulfotomaculum nigrificans]|nr:hypothetical protein [Desulfotomaculum nigrificans]